MMTRRTALSVIVSAPLAARAAIQSPPVRERRAFCRGSFTYVVERDGAVTVCLQGGMGFSGTNAGLGHEGPLPKGEAFALPTVRNAVEIAVGGSGAFAVMPDGRVLAWGINARGDLGITPLSELEAAGQVRRAASTPTPVLDIADAVRIAAGDNHAHAVTRSGAVYAWGYNDAGQLGIGAMPVIQFKTRSAQAMNFLPYPMRIPNLTGVTAVAAGGSHSLALMNDGTLRAWGLNRRGQLGDGTVVDRHAPVMVQGVKNAIAIVAGSWISGALLADGTVMMWGHGNGGLGRKDYKPDAPHPLPVTVPGVSGIRAFACGESHVLAITNNGTIVSWGEDLVGEIGHTRRLPAPIASLSGVRSVAATVARSLATLVDGTIMVWGDVPLHARIDGGSGNISRTPIPLVVKGLKNP